ncbi:hypothetical protein HAU32_07925 [Weissella confusa]|uniref:Uncharacterized protein n=1 Tax=Weissella fermenti TaxID=2987699 RepID=A0ABT6D021_9LACO|nr:MULTISPECIES: hypothetical protein [Weissella]MBJ7688899.1 hypothetical protein [Weissella confusa]MCW0926316.1 hypothetical protein [Weissella sp. LMG 11983]MDF9298738.1 hypothetical protein [Weissella sp. BK2]
MSDNKKHNNQGPLIFIGIAIGIVAILLGVLIYQKHESSPEVQSQKSSISSSKKNDSEQASLNNLMSKKEKQFRNAPKGNYLVLGTHVYKTNWSKEQLKDFLTQKISDYDQYKLDPFTTDFGTNKVKIDIDKTQPDAREYLQNLLSNLDNEYFTSAYAAWKSHPYSTTTLVK